MEVLENFKDLFFDVWNKGISGVNISEIIVALLIFLFFLFLRGGNPKYFVTRQILERPNPRGDMTTALVLRTCPVQQ